MNYASYYLDVYAEGLRETLYLWGEWGFIIVAVLVAAFIVHHAIRLWGVPAEAALAIILGTCIGLVASVLYFMRHYLAFGHIGTRALWFIVLYLWCVLGMLFFAAKHASKIKMFLALVSQAGILYALYALL